MAEINYFHRRYLRLNTNNSIIGPRNRCIKKPLNRFPTKKCGKKSCMAIKLY